MTVIDPTETYSVTLIGWKWEVILKELDKAANRQNKDVAKKGIYIDTADHVRKILAKQ